MSLLKQKNNNSTTIIVSFFVGFLILFIILVSILIGRLADKSDLREQLSLSRSNSNNAISESIELPSLAIVPFKIDEAGDVPKELVDAISKNISMKLSLNEFRVAQGNELDQFRNMNPTPAEVGESLGVRYVLIGLVGGLDEEIRIDAVLHDVVLGKSVFRGSFYGDRTTVAQLHDEVVSALLVVLNNIKG